MIDRTLRTLRLAERVVAATLLGLIVAVVFAATIGRYSGRPVIWSVEVAQGLFVWLSLLAADLTMQRGGHFSVDAITSLLPAGWQRALDLAVRLLMGALLLLLIYYGAVFTGISHGRPLPMTQVPSSFVIAALPVGFALMLLTLIEGTIRKRASADQQAGQPLREVL